MQQEENQFMGDQVIAAIKNRKTKMRPKWYFILQSTISAVAVIIVLFILVYIATFIVFALHQTGAWFVPVFGFAGWYAFFYSLPWVLVTLSAIFIVLLSVLISRYPFGYQWPILYSLLAILFIVISAGLLFAQTSFFESGPQGQFPVIGPFYTGSGMGMAAANVHRGQITAIVAGGFTLLDVYSATSSVIVSPQTYLPSGDLFQVGDAVVVFGDRSATGTIEASGVREIK